MLHRHGNDIDPRAGGEFVELLVLSGPGTVYGRREQVENTGRDKRRFLARFPW
ncbi:hypothetical protein DPPLL_03700 [Desulfofustis limnaeus]|uniref:Uncharacterized protein n=1 Tax=Desulfofustis limnaeus TaxID=2740163 RepID=A0ABM7W502_9BACT|nr:hypothetical protein DPPLL_03700 [Desulfofustis limnaeus]